MISREQITLIIQLIDRATSEEPVEEEAVKVVRDVTIGELIGAAKQRWQLPREDHYSMWLEQEARVLNTQTTIEQLQVSDDNKLQMGTQPPLPYHREVDERMFYDVRSKTHNIHLTLHNDHMQTEIRRLPVVIGRFVHRENSVFPELLRVEIDERDFVNPHGTSPARSVSRDHAIIFHHTSPEGRYDFYLFPLKREGKNPTFINGVKLEDGNAYLLKRDDIIQLGEVELEFEDYSTGAQ